MRYLFVLALMVLAVAAVADTSEHAAIKAAARDYLDGWYAGDAERMTRALHPDLAKRTVRVMESGEPVLNTLSASNMIAYTRSGFGKGKANPDFPTEVHILDVSPVTASVKTVSHEFVDYLHLAKIKGEWKIVNVLWEPAGE